MPQRCPPRQIQRGGQKTITERALQGLLWACRAARVPVAQGPVFLRSRPRSRPLKKASHDHFAPAPPRCARHAPGARRKHPGVHALRQHAAPAPWAPGAAHGTAGAGAGHRLGAALRHAGWAGRLDRARRRRRTRYLAAHHQQRRRPCSRLVDRSCAASGRRAAVGDVPRMVHTPASSSSGTSSGSSACCRQAIAFWHSRVALSGVRLRPGDRRPGTGERGR